MILEVATFAVQPGHEAAFEQAFDKAQRLLPGLAGYLSHELRRSVEREQLYALLIEWRAVDDRTLGFARSLAHQRWRELLQDHLAERPQVEFYRPLVSAASLPGKVRNASD
ncbi:antibiotic biosynthesis monooxygenase [Ideonella sp. DXS22W]|uniref:Antibiotic biosynthesis monooxygenase n=1 Tax=Pseudaquabacterium inlustre TaxID=2984192 RepID=A0ABU9CLZ1_9BURK